MDGKENFLSPDPKSERSRRPLSKFFKSSTLPPDFNITAVAESQKSDPVQETKGPWSRVRDRARQASRDLRSPDLLAAPGTPKSEVVDCAVCLSSEFCRFHNLKELFPSLGIHPTAANTELAIGGLSSLPYGFGTIPHICAHLAVGLSLYEPQNRGSAAGKTSPASPARSLTKNFTFSSQKTLQSQPSKPSIDSREIFASLLQDCLALDAPLTDGTERASLRASFLHERTVQNSERRVPSLIAILSFMLKSLNAICLHHSSSMARNEPISCLCPGRPCPIFLIRLLSGTNVLLSALEPVFRLQDATLQTLTLKFAWRLFHIAQYCAPLCSRFNTLKLHDTRSAHAFWSKMCLGIPVEMRESAFDDFVELIADRTEEKAELDNEGKPVKIDLFRADIKNPFLISHTFELLQGTSNDFKLKSLQHLLSALLTRSSTVFPIHHFFTCADRELGVLSLLSSLTWKDHEDFTVDGDIAHYAVGYLAGLLGSLSDTSFLSTARHTMTILNSFGPPSSSARRVFIIRQVLSVAIGSFKDHSGTMLQDVGGTMWSNWMHLVTIVLEFALFTGFINPLGSDNFPNREDYTTMSLLPSPPEFLFESTSRDFNIRSWNFAFHGPLKLHLGVRPVDDGKANKWVLVYEDWELVKRVEGTLSALGCHRPVEVFHSPGQKQAVTQCLQKGHQVFLLVQAILKVITDAGIAPPPSSSFAVLRHPRHFKQIGVADLERVRKFKADPLDDVLVAQATYALKAAQTASNVEALMATKDARATIAHLQRLCREKLHDFTNPEDTVRVIFQGTLLTSTRGNPHVNLLVQLQSDSLLFMDKAKSPTGTEQEKPYASLPLSAIKNIALDVPNTEPGMFSFALVGPPESFVAATPTQTLRDEWVNLISFATAHCRLEHQAQGDCLEGLHVLVSGAFREKSPTSRAALSSGALYSYRRLCLPSSSTETTTSTIMMRSSELPNCADCQVAFTMFNHRQHCPRCKRGFCQKCLSRPRGKEFGLAKLCNPCYVELTDAESLRAATRKDLLVSVPARAPPPRVMSSLVLGSHH